MFGLVVRFDLADEAAAARFDELTARTGAKIRDEEPGTLLYVVNTVVDSPLSRVFYEVYRDESAFDDHEATAHVKAFLEEREQYIANIRGRVPESGRRQEPARVTTSEQKDFGRRVAFLRKRHGYPQAEFARKVGRSETWVSQIERGVRKLDRLSVIEAVAVALDVSVDELGSGRSSTSLQAAKAAPASIQALTLAIPWPRTTRFAPWSRRPNRPVSTRRGARRPGVAALQPAPGGQAPSGRTTKSARTC